MRYLNLETRRTRIAIFDFTGCEGCQLQLLSFARTFVAFWKAIEVVTFRQATSARGQDYDVALIEGTISRADEVERLRTIRDRARVLVALGSCAAFGGVNRLKNGLDPVASCREEAHEDKPKDSLPVRAIKEVVPVDLEIPGCPVSRSEIEQFVQHLAIETPYELPTQPVCVECRQRLTTCTFDKGELCLGLITRGGCQAPCPAGGRGCWGCRGAVPDMNMTAFLDLAERRGHDARIIRERIALFGGFWVPT